MKRFRLLAATLTTVASAIAILLLCDLSAKAQKPIGKPPVNQAVEPRNAPPFDPPSDAKSNATAPDPFASPTTVAEQGPEQVVTEFLEASRKGDAKSAAALLSAKARKGLEENNMVINPPGSPTATFVVMKVEFKTPNKDGAHVPTSWIDITSDGVKETNELLWVLRKETEGWRIVGSIMQAPPGKEPLVLNFEDPEDMQRKMSRFLPKSETVQNDHRMTNSAPNFAGQIASPPGIAPTTFSPPSGTESVKKEPEKANQPQEIKVLSIRFIPALDLSNSLREVFKSTTIVPDPITNSIIIRADKDDAQAIQALAERLDTAAGNNPRTMAKAQEATLQTYSIPTSADSAFVLKILQAMLVNAPYTRLEIDPKSGKLVVFGEAKQQATIKATLEEFAKIEQQQPTPQKFQNALRYGSGGRGGQQLPSAGDINSYVSATNQKVISNPAAAAAEKKASELATEYRKLILPSTVATNIISDAGGVGTFSMVGMAEIKKQEELKAELRCEVEIAFKARQKTQTAELEQLRKRLNQIEAAISTREKNREAIINRRVEELINPDVKWDAGAATPKAPSAIPPTPSIADNSRYVPLTTMREVMTQDGIKPVYEQRMIEVPSSPSPHYQQIPIPQDSNGVSDDPAIGGIWVIISQTEGGHDRMQMKDHYQSCIIAGNKISWLRNSNRAAEEYTFKLNPNQQPKWIDVATADDRVSKGIYKLEDDTLTICMMDIDADRPTTFESKPKSRAMLVVLQRRHNATGQPTAVPNSLPSAIRPNTSLADQEAMLGEWKVESGMEGGKPAEHLPTKMVIAKEFLFMTDGKNAQFATYTLDPTKNPKWIDVQPQNYNGPPQKAIYKLQGDELILCTTKGNATGKEGERPTAFESKPDSPNYNLAVFKREKPPAYDQFAPLPGLVAIHGENGKKLLALQVSEPAVHTEPDSATAQQLLQGKWSVFIACDEGENRLLDQTNTPPSERLKGCVVEGNMLTFQMEDGTTKTAGFKLDPKHNPSWIDLEIGNRVFKGIYELNPRNATLTICYPEGSTKKRSTGFHSGINSENDVLIVFRRASPAQIAPPPVSRD